MEREIVREIVLVFWVHEREGIFFCLDLGHHWVKGKGSVAEITWTDRKRREGSKVARSRGIDLVFWKLS